MMALQYSYCKACKPLVPPLSALLPRQPLGIFYCRLLGDVRGKHISLLFRYCPWPSCHRHLTPRARSMRDPAPSSAPLSLCLAVVLLARRMVLSSLKCILGCFDSVLLWSSSARYCLCCVVFVFSWKGYHSRRGD